jgi:Na+-transporting methylmalonyl-CoA/oxaloacetate decarboxylase gamma subunit
MSMEQVLIVLLVVLVLLINFVAPVLKRMVQEEERAGAVSPTVTVRRRMIPVEQGPQAPQRSQLAPVCAAPAARRRLARPVSLHEARRGIVLMAILGPCRASDTTVFPNEPAFVRTVRRNGREAL